MTKYTFLSTPSARRATKLQQAMDAALKISIHALREEGDVLPDGSYGLYPISIHALREEGDGRHTPTGKGFLGFLSTPSARRATQRPQRPHQGGAISIHALREEGDPNCEA